jgi:predicted secreted protein
MSKDKPVPPKSINKVWEHIANGGIVYIPTYTRCTVINQKTVDKFRKVGAWLLKEDGDGYRMQTGKTSVYILPGQLTYGSL